MASTDTLKDYNAQDGVDLRLRRYDQDWRITDRSEDGEVYLEVTSPTVPRKEGVNTEFKEELKSDKQEREQLLKNPTEDKAGEVVERALREWQIRQKDERSSFERPE